MARPRLRVVTLNLWGDHAPFAARLALAAQQLAALAPDVVLLQEVRQGEGLDNTAGQLARALGAEWRWAYHCATSGAAGTWGPGSGAGEEGLAILARHPLRRDQSVELPDARPTERRVLLSALVDHPAGAVWCHTTHLHYRVRDGAARERQVLCVEDTIAALAASMEPGRLHVLGGDFNTVPDSDEVRFLTGRHTLGGRRASWRDAFAQARPMERGLTWVTRNPYTHELAWLPPDRRLDYLFVSAPRGDGTGQVLHAQVVLDEPMDGVWPSDHLAVMADVAL